MTKTTITINGRVYDAITGMPILTNAMTDQTARKSTAKKQMRAFSDVGPSVPTRELAKPQRPVANEQLAPQRVHETQAPAQAMHQATQKSHTLYRKALKKPAAAQAIPAAVAAPAPTQPAVQKQATSLRSPMISRFSAQAAQEPQSAQSPEEPIKPAAMHPSVAKAFATKAAAQPQQPALSGHALKEALIKERLAEVDTTHNKKEHKRSPSRRPRLVAILSSTLALLVLGGYLTYITLPSISLRVAASRAGLNATMPDYKPDGYSLDGPIAYSPGEVIIGYKSNTNDSGYKLTQKATNWDSQAVLDNYVTKNTDNYLTFQERGITVYTFNNKAAWVNGGLLYTIEGNAALSSDQVLRIATSM